ncbi:aminoglycoside phosphotransferase family protein [Pseudobacillus sp. FSL P4-0506]|uniref:aminoglycoside phosphotransferase family protein n=1 Tax=Pseudobacillus sp. FSL P4-0506 TaxID=2921576 RepID=UPI0030F70EC1
MKNKFQQGDGLTPRLLFLLSARLEETIQTVFSLKKGKWLVITNRNKWFVKKYASLSQLEKQIQLCHFLSDQGFTQVILFHSVTPIIFEKQIFAVMPFIEPAKKTFYFQTEEEREEALALLSVFHQQTEKLPEKITACFPHFDQAAVWRKRLTAFQRELPELIRYFPASVLEHYAEAGKWCLDHLSDQPKDEGKLAVIHGDVASHNFFRSADGTLYLIDFDLAAQAPVLFDYVQWTNRVLPLVDWNLEKVMEHRVITPYTHKKNWFIYTLFPADVFRECRRFARAPLKEKKSAYKHAYELTVKPFTQRKIFFKRWKKVWEDQQG